MISLDQALKIVLDASYTLASEKVDLMLSTGRVLAEDVISDMDMPPFDKSAMDGFACRREDLGHELEVIEINAPVCTYDYVVIDLYACTLLNRNTFHV